MISERTLRNWRRDALIITDNVALALHETTQELNNAFVTQQRRIRELTQELLDLHLIKKG